MPSWRKHSSLRTALTERDRAWPLARPGPMSRSRLDRQALPDKGWASKGIRVAAVRIDDTGAQVGGLFVPLKAETFLTETLSSYAGGGGSNSAAKRIERIERIAPGTIETLWVDRRPLPDVGQRIWWECWCWKEAANNLPRPAERLGLRVSDQRLLFPEFEVVPVYGT